MAQRYYRRFAAFAAERGYLTLTFDYRGIGRSAPSDPAGLPDGLSRLGRLDLAAAVERISDDYRPLFVIGHSYGGHGFGALPDPQRVAAFFTFGTGAGWSGWMPTLERLRVLALWHGLGPLLTRSSGYLSWSVVGMGEDLPLDFYRQWKRWCRYRRNFLEDPAMADVAQAFARIRLPIMAANAVDDRWSPPRSRDAFMTGYQSAALDTLDLVPGEFGMAAIGHMGYFRADATGSGNGRCGGSSACQPGRNHGMQIVVVGRHDIDLWKRADGERSVGRDHDHPVDLRRISAAERAIRHGLPSGSRASASTRTRIRRPTNRASRSRLIEACVSITAARPSFADRLGDRARQIVGRRAIDRRIGEAADAVELAPRRGSRADPRTRPRSRPGSRR